MWHVFINSRFKACPRLLPVVNTAHQQFSKLRVEQAGIDSWRATRIRQRAFCCGARNEDRRWCYEHIAAVGARAEMLRIRNEATGIFVGALFHYMVDYDLDGMIDVGSTTRIEPPPRAPIAAVIQFFHRSTGRGDQYRADYQKMYDEGIQLALKYLGE